MADLISYRPEPGSIPTNPGVYRYLDADGRVIYVGKAKNLRNRLNSYFADPMGLHPRTQKMLKTAVKVEWTVVANELESLQLEYTWIKQFQPRFNVMYRDDKSYPYLAVSYSEEFPRVFITRGAKRAGWRYFGPYVQVWSIRETLDLLLRVFPVRSCSAGVFNNAKRSNRACLLGHIGKCCAPCIGNVSPQEHRQKLDDFMSVLAGNAGAVLKKLKQQMNQAAAELAFEKAAVARDAIAALNKVIEKTAVVFSDGTDADLVALASDDLEVAVQIFSVRHGRIVGERSWVADRIDDSTEAELMESFLLQLYGEYGIAARKTAQKQTGKTTDLEVEVANRIPREILVGCEPKSVESLTEYLTEQRQGPVHIRVPARGEKKQLMTTAVENAALALTRHKNQRSSDLTVRSQALAELQEALGIEQAPLRIECYDISHIQGSQVVGSMVVFEDGLPRKSEYRRFIIKSFSGSNDFEAMREVLTRRLKRLISDQQLLNTDTASGELSAEEAESLAGQKFSYPPQMIVVDGGLPQVNAAHQVLVELGLEEKITLVGLAKRLEEVWLVDEEYPLILPRNSEGLYLLQRLRDEAHRFAITFHRQRRSKAMVDSVLDQVPGLGEVRRKALLKHFGSLKKLKAAPVEQIAQVPGIGQVTAAAIKEILTSQNSESGVNLTTGEILED